MGHSGGFAFFKLNIKNLKKSFLTPKPKILSRKCFNFKTVTLTEAYSKTVRNYFKVLSIMSMEKCTLIVRCDLSVD